MNPRPYQREAMDAGHELYAKGVPNFLFAMATGTGKTRTAVWFVREHLERQGVANPQVLWLAHREELADQAIEAIGDMCPGLEVGKVQGGTSQFDRPWTVAMIQTAFQPNRLFRLRAHAYNAIVVDECFPAGTIVGDKPIEDVCVGDCVPAYDAAAGVPVVGCVIRVFRSIPSMLVRVCAGGRSVTCTPGHPFLTTRGWVPASQLTLADRLLVEAPDARFENLCRMRHEPDAFDESSEQAGLLPALPTCTIGSTPEDGGDALRGVRLHGRANRHEWARSGSEGPSILLRELQDGVAIQVHVGPDAQDESARPRTPLKEDERAQPHGEAGGSSPGFGHAARDGLEATAKREWAGTHRAAAPVGGALGMADGGHRSHEATSRERLPHGLQGGRGQRGSDDRCGSGRWVAHEPGEQGEGPEEGGLLAWARVDRVEILEPGRDGRFGGLCPDGAVYNLEVERVHTYVAAGFVVHNCHHSAANSYRKVVKSLQTPTTLTLGLSATPNRADGKALDLYDRIAFAYLLPDAIADGFLVDLEGIRVHLDLDLSDPSLIDRAKGDFKEASLSARMMEPDAIAGSVDAYEAHLRDRRTIAFAVRVDHARAVCDALRSRGYRADYVDGSMPTSERHVRYEAMRRHELDVLVNVAVLTEGFDLPAIDGVLLLRPTASHGLYTQMVGRGARLSPQTRKVNCRVVDVTGTCDKLSLLSLPMLGGLPPDTEDAPKEAREECSKVVERDGNVERIPSLLACARAATRVELLRTPRGQRFAWRESEWGLALYLGTPEAGWILVRPHKPTEPSRVQGRHKIVHLRQLAGQDVTRSEVLAEGLFATDAVGLAEQEAVRFAPRRRTPGAPVIGPGDADDLASGIDAVRRLHAEVNSGRSTPNAKAGTAASPQAVSELRRLRVRMTDDQAASLTHGEAETMLRQARAGGRRSVRLPERLRGIA